VLSLSKPENTEALHLLNTHRKRGETALIPTSMNIAHFESSLDWGGQELRVVEQSAWLNQHGHPTWVIARPQSAILAQAQARHLPHVALPIRGALNLTTLRDLLRFLHTHRITLLDCHSNRDSYYGAYVKWLTRIKVVRSRHVTVPIKTAGLRSVVWRYGHHGVVVTAKAIREHLAQQGLVPPEKVLVAPAGVDPQRFHPQIDSQTLRRELGIPPEHRIIANVGMIRPDKGQLYFVQACRQLLAQQQAVTCIQVGAATGQTQAYQQQVQAACGDELGRGIRFLGYHDDIERYLALADVVVVASVATEAQTRLVAQAFLMQKNVVATTTGGLPEMIAHQHTGLLCPPADADALAQAVKTVLDQPRLAKQLAQTAYQHAQQTMTFDYMMAEMVGFYQRLLTLS